MLEKIGNIFEQSDADAICFTSNGVLNKHGHLVMGAGIAKSFKDKWTDLPKYFGDSVKIGGNHLYIHPPVEGYMPCWIVSFPTKNHWKENSDIKLIEQSARELVGISFKWGWKHIYLPRPGCGLGGLDWEKEVKPLLSSILVDDKFVVITNG